MSIQTLPLIDEPKLEALGRVLREGAQKAGLPDVAFASLLRPLELLRLLARHAPGVLADELAAELRFHLAINAAAPFYAWGRLVETRVREPAESTELFEVLAVPMSAVTGVELARPMLFDVGAFGVLALASHRVARDDGATSELYRLTLLGLAVAAARADFLARHEPRSPEDLSVYLDVSTAYATALAEVPQLGAMLYDRTSIAQIRCVVAVLEGVFGSIERAQKTAEDMEDRTVTWHTTRSYNVASVLPSPAAPSTNVTVTVREGQEPLDDEQLVWVSDAKRISEPLDASASLEAVAVPNTTKRTAWVGFFHPPKREDTNKFRARLAEFLLDASMSPCLDGARARMADFVVPLGDDMVPAPPPTADNRLEVDVPQLLWADVTPEVAKPAELVTVHWKVRGAAGVRVDGGELLEADEGRALLTAPVHAGRVDVELVPVRSANAGAVEGAPMVVSYEVPLPRPINLRIRTADGSAPTHEGQDAEAELELEWPASPDTVSITIMRPDEAPTLLASTTPSVASRHRASVPAGLLRTGSVFIGRVFDEETETVVHTLSAGPIELAEPAPLRVVVVRPTTVAYAGGKVVEERVAGEWRAALAQSAARHGRSTTVFELPWVDDALAVVAPPIHDPDDVRLVQITERLHRRAHLTPGYEDALWIVLLPATNVGVCRWAKGVSARAVAVVFEGCFDVLLDELQTEEVDLAPAADTIRRIRVESSQRSEADAVLAASAFEAEGRHPGGAGAPFDSGLDVEVWSTGGSLVGKTRMTAFREEFPRAVFATVPAGDEVDLVRVVDGDRVLFEERRGPDVSVEVQVDDADPTAFTWSARRGRVDEAVVQVKRGDVRTPVARVDVCKRTGRWPVGRFEAVGEVDLWVRRGWSTAEAPFRVDRTTFPGPLVLRQVGPRRFWVEAPPNGEGRIEWRLDDAVIEEDARMLELEERDHGVLSVRLVRDGGMVVEDSVVVEVGR